MPRSLTVLLLIASAATLACRDRGSKTTSASGGCDPSIKLPEGFCATVFAESAGPVRHIAVRKNGDVIAGVLDQRRTPGAALFLRDTNHDGHADLEVRAGDIGVHGVALSASDSGVYVSNATSIIHYRLGADLEPKKKVDTIVVGLPTTPIPSHSLALSAHGNVIVNIGAASNACQPKEEPRVPGRDPCPELATTGGIWSFRTDKTNQKPSEGTRVTTGLKNAIALTVNPTDTMVYAVSHGRDKLHDLWPDLYTDDDAGSRAAEEMVRVATARADFGWPYCFYDYIAGHRVLAPEYGGDKQRQDRCDRLIQPLTVFPAHRAPMAMLFYTGKMFPERYRSGVFVAFHGSANRAPLPEEGYDVVFVPFKDDLASGGFEEFATGFAGRMMNPAGALHRPSGLAEGPDGALYVSDDKGGRIWRITYKK